MHDMFNMDGASKFHFDWKDLVKKRAFREGCHCTHRLCVQEQPHLPDGRHLLRRQFSEHHGIRHQRPTFEGFSGHGFVQIVTMHIQSVDQNRAIKTVKRTITELDRSKIEEQKKAIRAGYDIDIIPSDLATYGGMRKPC